MPQSKDSNGGGKVAGETGGAGGGWNRAAIEGPTWKGVQEGGGFSSSGGY